MDVKNTFLAGVVEGFYGHPWSHQVRLDYANYLNQLGGNCYLYCPKSDPYLRRDWPQQWPTAQWQQLRELARHYHARNIFWGVGLSPFALYQRYGVKERRQLQVKLARLSELDAPLLAILFDDMPGGIDNLAERQAEIVADVCAAAPTQRILMCPTYYSFDPVLPQHFGTMPADYWPQLGRLLPTSVDIFWTGNRVCSPSISSADITAITTSLGRPVTLWDNYPVNDGAQRSNFLYCDPLPERQLDAAELRGHLCNPMNQALLSLPGLRGLASCHGLAAPVGGWEAEVLGADCWRQLQRDRDLFKTLGLSGMSQSQRELLIRDYRKLPGEAAAEVVAWLRGEYAFDPACLTD